MSLPVPVLDDRSFQDLVDECKRMIPRFTPEWTDHNVSDPGVTLIELFAWMTELLLYRVNQVPRRNYIKFLELIGVRLQPPQPARTEVTFRLAAPQPVAVTIPAGTEVSTRRTATQEAIIFATERPLQIQVPVLAEALISRDELSYLDFMPALRDPGLRVPVFEEPPRPGNGFYLGYQGNLAAHTLHLTIDCQIQGIGVDPRDPPLAWDYFDGNLQTWRPMRLELDTTGGLNRRGEVIVTIPTTSRPVELDRRRATWIRCRVVEPRPRQRGYTVSPRVLALHTQSIGGAVIASHCETISHEQLGRSDGTPAQTCTLGAHPILPRRVGETLEVETDEAGVFEPWQEVADFAASGAADRHFVCDSVSGEVRFGPSVRMPNGDEVQYGAVPRQGSALRFTHYRIGGGIVGNLGAETLTALKTSIPYVAAVTNVEPATGGTEAESLEAALLRGPRLLRSSPRAVTAADFERLAVEATPDVVRAHCEYARLPEDGQAGRVRLVVVPRMTTTEGVVPPEQLALSDDVLRAVQRYLDERRMLTVRLSLEAPHYVAVAIYAVIYVQPGVDQAAMQATAEQALYRFIHPTVGGPEASGWPFGRALFASDIFGLLSHIDRVEYVGTVQFATMGADDTMQPVTSDAVRPPALALLCSGPHRVSVQRVPRG